MAIAEEEELIDGLTFDEWCDLIPVGLEKMTEVEKAEAGRERDARVAAIRQERFGGKPWQTAVYGKRDTYPAATGGDPLMVAEPQAAYGPTGTPEQEAAIFESIARRDAGERFLTAEEFFANLRAAIDGVKYARP